MAQPRKIDALIPLQALDLEIHRLKVQRTEKPALLAPAEQKLAHAKQTVADLHAEIKALKLEGSKRELSVKEFDDRIAKIQAQSMQSKKNDEYQTYQKEISGIRAEKARVEDGLLDIYMQVEEKGKLEKVRAEELKAAEADFATAKKANDAEVSEINRRVEDLLGKRAGLIGAVDKEIIRMYERILEAKDDGIALAAIGKYDVIEDEGKVTYWQCEGCNVSLNMQDVNLIMMGRELQICRSCSRLLYIKPQ